MSTPLDIVFAGTPQFAAALLQALLSQKHRIVAVYTQPDRPAGRGRKLRASPVKQLADHAGLAVRQLKRFDERECTQLAALSADVMLVCAYGLLLPRQALDLPRLGCINVHTSLLPRWRGAAPIQRALIAGDRETGISFMQMVEALDAGPVLHQTRCEIDPGDTANTLRERLIQLARDEMPEVLGGLAEGRIEPKPQDLSKVCHAPKVDKSEALIDWRESAMQIERKVRAFNDWPVAYTFLGQDRVRIWESHCLPGDPDGVPGVVMEARKAIRVATGAGMLGIDRLQLPGGKPLPAHDFLNAHDLGGQRFTTEAVGV
ncbi:MAG: methionyl-tRNA formyltransferase [Proteobacteria bacterium]|nr:methionyl-tRNA formyltransferase [Pseudomonadota bacterium]